MIATTLGILGRARLLVLLACCGQVLPALGEDETLLLQDASTGTHTVTASLSSAARGLAAEALRASMGGADGAHDVAQLADGRASASLVRRRIADIVAHPDNGAAQSSLWPVLAHVQRHATQGMERAAQNWAAGPGAHLQNASMQLAKAQTAISTIKLETELFLKSAFAKNTGIAELPFLRAPPEVKHSVDRFTSDLEDLLLRWKASQESASKFVDVTLFALKAGKQTRLAGWLGNTSREAFAGLDRAYGALTDAKRLGERALYQLDIQELSGHSDFNMIAWEGVREFDAFRSRIGKELEVIETALKIFGQELSEAFPSATGASERLARRDIGGFVRRLGSLASAWERPLVAKLVRQKPDVSAAKF